MKNRRFEENLKENERGLFGWKRILVGSDVFSWAYQNFLSPILRDLEERREVLRKFQNCPSYCVLTLLIDFFFFFLNMFFKTNSGIMLKLKRIGKWLAIINWLFEPSVFIWSRLFLYVYLKKKKKKDSPHET